MGQGGAWRGQVGPVTARVGVRYELSQLESAAVTTAHANRFTGRSTLSLWYAPPESLHAVLAAALEHHATQSESGPRGSESMPQARGGAVLSPAEFLDLRGNVGLAQRPPPLGELYGVWAVRLPRVTQRGHGGAGPVPRAISGRRGTAAPG